MCVYSCNQVIVSHIKTISITERRTQNSVERRKKYWSWEIKKDPRTGRSETGQRSFRFVYS